MRNGLVNYRINPSMDDGCVIVRRARKAHTCHGQPDRKRCPSPMPITPNTTYIEYVGESPIYSPGKRYCLSCAVTQGLIQSLAEVR